jgi:hypothetical protein
LMKTRWNEDKWMQSAFILDNEKQRSNEDLSFSWCYLRWHQFSREIWNMFPKCLEFDKVDWRRYLSFLVGDSNNWSEGEDMYPMQDSVLTMSSSILWSSTLACFGGWPILPDSFLKCFNAMDNPVRWQAEEDTIV